MHLTAISAASLKTPLFHPDNLPALNYGATGTVIGHELTHALDSSGRYYDKTGSFRSWWTKNATEAYANRTECFVKQFDSQREPITGLHVSNNTTTCCYLTNNQLILMYVFVFS